MTIVLVGGQEVNVELLFVGGSKINVKLSMAKCSTKGYNMIGMLRKSGCCGVREQRNKNGVCYLCGDLEIGD